MCVCVCILKHIYNSNKGKRGLGLCKKVDEKKFKGGWGCTRKINDKKFKGIK